jgi:hypothetical protein
MLIFTFVRIVLHSMVIKNIGPKDSSIGATKLKIVIEWLTNSIIHRVFGIGDVLPLINKFSKKLLVTRMSKLNLYFDLKNL